MMQIFAYLLHFLIEGCPWACLHCWIEWGAVHPRCVLHGEGRVRERDQEDRPTSASRVPAHRCPCHNSASGCCLWLWIPLLCFCESDFFFSRFKLSTLFLLARILSLSKTGSLNPAYRWPCFSLYLFDILVQDFNAFARYISQFKDSEFPEFVSDLHVLVFMATLDIMPLRFTSNISSHFLYCFLFLREYMGPLYSALASQSREQVRILNWPHFLHNFIIWE